MNIEAQDLKIIKDILKDYPYTFYAFGSRVTYKNKPLSDLDLCFFDDIPHNARDKLEESFEESDLPYKVDIVDWHACDQEFQKIILKHTFCLQASKYLCQVETSIFDHFAHLYTSSHTNIKKEDGYNIINNNISMPQFNIAYNTKNIFIDNFNVLVKNIIDYFKEQPFSWIIGPTQQSYLLNQTLIKNNFYFKCNKHIMLCDLANIDETDKHSDLEIQHILNAQQLDMIARLPECIGAEIKMFCYPLISPTLIKKANLYVGYISNQPTILGTIFYCGASANMSIYCIKDKINSSDTTYTHVIIDFIKILKKTINIKYITFCVPEDISYHLYKHWGIRCLGQITYFEFSPHMIKKAN